MMSKQNCISRKEKKRKDYAFRRYFNEKPSIIPGCPALVCSHICMPEQDSRNNHCCHVTRYLAVHICSASALIGNTCEFEISARRLPMLRLQSPWTNVKSQQLSRPAVQAGCDHCCKGKFYICRRYFCTQSGELLTCMYAGLHQC